MKKKKNTENRIHFFTVIISFVIVTSIVLSSCGLVVINYPFNGESDNFTTEETGYESESETDNPYHIIEAPDNFEKAVKYLSELKSVDMGGAVINIVEVSDFVSMYSDIYMLYNETVEKRDEYIERKYNVTINRTKKRIDVILNEMITAKKKRKYYADLVLLPVNYIGFLQENGAITDVNLLEGTDYSAPYFDYDAMIASSAGAKTFAIVGEASKLSESYECIFVNKDLLRNAGLEIPYHSVYDGTWTFDMFSFYTDKILEYYNALPDDTGEENSSENNADSEIFAVGSDLGSMKNLVSSLFYGTGQNFFNNSISENPTPAFQTDETQYYLDLMTEMVDKGVFLPDERDDSDALRLFASSKLPFYIGKISDFFQFSTKGFDWGIIPYPKINSSQKEYGGAISSSTCAYVVPAYVNKDEVGYIVQAMNAIYYGGFSDALLNKMFLLFVCDTDTLSMIDIISNCSTYDFSEFFKTVPIIQGISADALYHTFEKSDTLAENIRKNTYELTMYLKRYFKIEQNEE